MEIQLIENVNTVKTYHNNDQSAYKLYREKYTEYGSMEATVHLK